MSVEVPWERTRNERVVSLGGDFHLISTSSGKALCGEGIGERHPEDVVPLLPHGQHQGGPGQPGGG